MTNACRALSCVLVCICCAASGCTYIGAAAAVMPPPTVEAQYTAFGGQTIGVMVWADRSIRVDWPNIQIDLANSIQNKLAAHTSKGGALEGARFPTSPRSMVDFQQDHPEVEFAPIESTAPKLGVTRLIYVEIEDFATRTDIAGKLFLGQIKATLKVVEVADRKGVVAYEERDINATFPPKTRPEGTIRGSDTIMYSGVLEMLAMQIQDRFIPHEME